MSKAAIGDKVDFKLIETGIMNSTFKNCTYQGETSYAVAIAVSPEINDLHNAFFPYFKEGYPDVKKPSDYNYILLTLSNGNSTAVGIPWILESTFQIVTNQECAIKIHNYRGLMEAPIRDLLKNLGADFSFETTSRK